MYQATAPAELDCAEQRFSEREQLERLDRFLTAVSAGWDEVMDFLESCRSIARHASSLGTCGESAEIGDREAQWSTQN